MCSGTLISSTLISSTLISSTLISSTLISSTLISSTLISSTLISSTLISSTLISSCTVGYKRRIKVFKTMTQHIQYDVSLQTSCSDTEVSAVGEWGCIVTMLV